MLFWSLCLLTLAILILRYYGSPRPMKVAGTFMTLFLLILSGVHVVSNYFTGAGINASVSYHLRVGFASAGIGEYTTIIVVSAAFLLTALGISVFVLHYLYKSSKPVSKKFQFIAIALFIAATVVNPAGKDLFRLYAPRYAIFAGNDSSGFSRLYILPDAVQAASPLNLVFIYLESLERVNADSKVHHFGRFKSTPPS